MGAISKEPFPVTEGTQPLVGLYVGKAAASASSRAHVVADQSEALDFLADPATHHLSVPPLSIETHGAVVFLAGDNAYDHLGGEVVQSSLGE